MIYRSSMFPVFGVAQLSVRCVFLLYRGARSWRLRDLRLLEFGYVLHFYHELGGIFDCRGLFHR